MDALTHLFTLPTTAATEGMSGLGLFPSEGTSREGRLVGWVTSAPSIITFLVMRGWFGPAGLGMVKAGHQLDRSPERRTFSPAHSSMNGIIEY